LGIYLDETDPDDPAKPPPYNAQRSRLPIDPLVLDLNGDGSSFGSVIGNVCVWGYRQESTDSQYIGRVPGLTGSIFKLLMPASLPLPMC
jgi:hypothetical protein